MRSQDTFCSLATKNHNIEFTFKKYIIYKQIKLQTWTEVYIS